MRVAGIEAGNIGEVFTSGLLKALFNFFIDLFEGFNAIR